MGSNNKKKLSKEAVRGADLTIFCKIFSDQVSPHLCDIRRKELIVQGTFSCADCSNTSGKVASSNP